MANFIRLLIFVFVFLGTCWVLIRFFENKLVFFPQQYPSGFEAVSLLNSPPEDYFIPVDGNTIHAWNFGFKTARKTILFFHGNAGNLAGRLHFFQHLDRYLDVNIFAIDYSGYGKSTGSPSEKNVYRDAKAAYDYLNKSLGVSSENIIIWGRSLGGAIAVNLATERNAKALILEATFSSGKDMIKQMFGIIPVGLATSIKFNSTDKIINIDSPKLFIHGDADSVVPFDLGRKLFTISPEPKQFITLPGANHNDTYIVGGDKYWQAIRAFIAHISTQTK